MKYKIVFSAERRKSKKSGNIITRSIPIRMRVSFNGQRVEMTTGMRFDEDVWNDILLLADKQKRRNVSLSQKRRIDAALSGVGTDIHSVHKQLRELESRVDGVFKVFNAFKRHLPILLLHRDALFRCRKPEMGERQRRTHRVRYNQEQ